MNRSKKNLVMVISCFLIAALLSGVLAAFLEQATGQWWVLYLPPLVVVAVAVPVALRMITSRRR
ncbi:hypothetical protein [Saccharothrix sp. Mg75]|uniref:hypothetical protein n=1 Tax=Saccharothrix sp. Mg75 TaxID=3445357 RepID=UPI003EE830BF